MHATDYESHKYLAAVSALSLFSPSMPTLERGERDQWLFRLRSGGTGSQFSARHPPTFVEKCESLHSES